MIQRSEWNIIFNSISDAVCLLDKSHTILECNNAMSTLFNKPVSEIIGKPCWEIIHGNSELFDPCPVSQMEKSLVRESTEIVLNEKHFEITVDPVLDAEGALFQSIHIIRDISERKTFETELSFERERLAVTLRSIGDGVITTDTRGRVVFLNAVAEEMTGWPTADAYGRPLTEVFHIINEFTRQRCENPVEKVLKTGLIVELANHTMLISRDGRELVLADSGSPIKNDKGEVFGVVLVFRDITEKQKMIDTIQQTQKLDSLGILAGGIAHDFNNLLGGIFGYIDLALTAATINPEIAENLESAMGVITRAKGLTQQLLTFAKGGSPIRKVGQIAKTVKDASLFALSGSSIKCRFEAATGLFDCEYDENQIAQTVDNIVLNAQQSMPMGGTIDITVQNWIIEKGAHELLAPGKYILISVQDYGVGIPKEIQARIFDPFFTTKQKGHGLGLSTAHSIIRKHDGLIDVRSEPAKGSCFTIYLPAIDHISFSPEKASSSADFSGSGNILIMDDEDFIRDTVATMLKRLGYTPVCVKDGTEALEVFTEARNSNNPFTAIILDLTIPGNLGGKEVISKIREFDTTTPAIVMSGYSDDTVLGHPRKSGFNDSLAKPFTGREIGRILKELLKS